ncbi:MAG: TPM domain-containing protein [Bacteroidia bacterium]|nr:TPM domain-containing protein [Bacteroidia bacterium]
MSAKNFFTEEQKQAIQQAIANAELNTSGEVRVHIEAKCKGDALNAAVETFDKLKMHKTALRNGVLFYIAVDDKKLAIVGDKGINETVPKGFWDTIRDTMLSHFKNQEFTEGLCKGIEMAGEKLKTHFPYQSNDKNELSNDVSFGK